MGLGNYKDKIIFIVLLALQNIIIFWQHYFNNAGFPWDFNGTEYAWPAFWTTSVSMGVFPQWIPYQSMGYPLALQDQAAFYYPIYWIFAILHIPYTLNAAVIVETLHVLFGSIGMFLLLNSIFKSSRFAFIGAVAFQFFGGFYAISQNTGIVRAFALAPWAFYAFKLNTEDPRITRPLLFIPIVIYFLATGAYPGNFISTLFIMLVFLSLQIIDSYLKHTARRRLLNIGGAMIGLLILGISLSAINLGPIDQDRNELTRFHNYWTDPQNRIHTSLEIRDFPGLAIPDERGTIDPVNGHDYEQRQLSMFITLPILIFASFISVSEIKKNWVFIAVLILSILMVFGEQSPFWQVLTSGIVALKLSRFPSTDFQVFIAIPIVILGIAGLRRIIQRTLSRKEFLARVAFVIGWFSLILFSLYSNNEFFAHTRNGLNLQHEPSQWFVNLVVIISVIVLAATLFFIMYRLFFIMFRYPVTATSLSSTNKSNTLTRSSLAIIFIFIIIDGLFVISDQRTWYEKPLGQSYINFHVPLEKNGTLITYSIFKNIPNERPARTYFLSDPVKDIFCHNFCWMGYLNGSYMMQDYTNAILVARSIVESNNGYRQYMLMKWTPILLEINSTKSSVPTRIYLSSFSDIVEQRVLCARFTCDSAFSSKHLIQPEKHSGNQTPTTADQVVQTRYGINDIVYKVKLKEPKLMVENEIYFPGWQADLIVPGKVIKLHAYEVNGAFRAWLLPAGQYQMIAHFSFPNLLVYQGISAVSFVIWIFIMVLYWRRTRDYDKQIIKREVLTRS
jgi:hypothetical protein